MINVMIFDEYAGSQKNNLDAQKFYPGGIHKVLKAKLEVNNDFSITTATQEDYLQVITDEVLDKTDVMLWWGHCMHKHVDDAFVEKLCKRVLNGMGIIFLHSSHFSKAFKKLLGTSCTLKWREADDLELLWNIKPMHPICKGIPECIKIEKEEMYGEFFDIPTPDELIFIGSFPNGGEVFRSGCTFTRGNGKIFYFQPGHESYPTYHKDEIITILANAIRWAVNENKKYVLNCENWSVKI